MAEQIASKQFLNFDGLSLYDSLIKDDLKNNIVDNCESQNADKPLSANQGYALQIQINELSKKMADHMYEVIKFTKFSSNISTVELGYTVNSVTLTWETSKQPKTLTLDGATIDATKKSHTYDYSSSPLKPTSVTTKGYTIVATDERDGSSSANAYINFVNGVYYGVSAIPNTYNSDFILSLTKKLSKAKVSSIDVTAGENQYIYYCLPTVMGTCTFNVGGFDGGFTLVDTINFTNSCGYTTNYYIYRSDNANLGKKIVKIT